MKEELYGLANHIAGAKGGLPRDWQDWANEIEMDLRKLANWEAQPVALVDRRQAARGGICWQHGGKDLPHGTEPFTAPPAPSGEVVVTRNERGDIVAVTRQDGEGRVIEVIAESNAPPAPAVPDEKPKLDYNPSMSWGDQCVAIAEIRGWNACRAAMLKGAK